MLSLLGNQTEQMLRIHMTNDLTPTDFELQELQAEIDSENETIQNEINAEASIDDWIDVMMHGLLEDIQY